ncbi:bifunctional diaminohydroxyphosphoribosylaminopyrimidine deaminase/5-amino-6-(5-phosphoribosylamino)uracil reductase RibD [Vibrio fluvialis]|uniref:bifunctional diaminohydroxyphosphoribosylaminopyrimidine deaminase/5-amino-6-(5-phosphoribosylamino)uracil reductase RibD n=1 Tax=Vibrio fluvialis TaxID=676 RepID=UPI00192B5B82|nr:bifunctional diaminohydroxyphosphoribosylaminopyrimidine deaminase/5-amino-6-(5-phosphoribosylamino)uracil reductase RibD [Vibrio fluvialis]EKO3535874.1 bifunctional diaminohydroxyphosphoribosylaminopyrimidine deaminase/5-amino-6-(5-phosphoribosylamino)uracil reductase RibD [Vibrio fluvialis]EKO3538215.1 bifunctional diaminohydroxyphosphoribosylaminopyrimidine deaminase/5-amino-6-(5-phosphoribosylamino)uracil reductase RibD [Vibrio fluvialis]MBL4280386.1 bifunctional diaminohydroxyphosphoribo
MPTFTSFDYQMMSRAIKLAQRGRFTTAPNPNVGCVITQGESIVGEGFHFRAGEPHAEVHALRMAGEKSVGATAYVTLEPCSHYGRTPPCAEGLIKAGVARVVCAMQDPNPQVSGRGIQMLRDAGIDVQVGLLEADAQALNPAFIKRMKTGMPFVQLKMAASLDGQTALANGRSQWITSKQARQDVQAYRAKAGAVLSTSQTVLADNASLSVRWAELPTGVQAEYGQENLRQPIRVILDRQHQLHGELKLYAHDGAVLRVAGEQADVCVALDEHEQLNLAETLADLAKQHNINHIWVEAGATLAKSLLEQQLVDELILYLAPKIMGSDGRGLFGALGLTDMQQVLNLNIQDCRMVGPDIRVVATPELKDE